jgi:hypothetical protein
MCVGIYVYIGICIYTYMCVYIYEYIYTHTRSEGLTMCVCIHAGHGTFVAGVVAGKNKD